MVDRKKQAEEAKNRVLSGTSTSGGSYNSLAEARDRRRRFEGINTQYSDARRDALQRSEQRTNDRVRNDRVESLVPEPFNPDRMLPQLTPPVGPVTPQTQNNWNNVQQGMDYLASQAPVVPQPPKQRNGFLDTIGNLFDPKSYSNENIAKNLDGDLYPVRDALGFGQNVVDSATLGAVPFLGDQLRKIPGSQYVMTPKSTTDAIDRAAEAQQGTPLGVTADLLGALVPYAGAYKATGGLARALNAGRGPIASNFVRGTLAGGAFGVANEAGEAAFGKNNQPIPERIRDVGVNALLGGAGDAAISALAPLAGRLAQKYLPTFRSTPDAGINTQALNGARSTTPLSDARRVAGRNGIVSESPAPAPVSAAPDTANAYRQALADGDITAMRAIDPDTAAKMAAYEATGGSIRDLPSFLRPQILKRLGISETAPESVLTRAASNPVRDAQPDDAVNAFQQFLRQNDNRPTPPNGKSTEEFDKYLFHGGELPKLNEEPQIPRSEQVEILKETLSPDGKLAEITVNRNGGVSKMSLPTNSETYRMIKQFAEDWKMSKQAPPAPAGRNAPEVPAARVFDESIPGAGRNAPEAIGGTRERGVVTSLAEQEKIPPEMVEYLRQNPNSRYNPINNEATVAQANARMNESVDRTYDFVMGKDEFTAEKGVAAQRLIDHYNSKGNYRRAATIADRLAEEATRAGQFIQAQSIRDKLTPDGVLIMAKRMNRRLNATLPKNKRINRVTTDVQARITEISDVAQRMQGTKGNANDVLDMLQSKAKGEKLTPQEATALRQLVDDSRIFIEDATRSVRTTEPPRVPKDQKLRKAVGSFLDAQETAARNRIRARKGTLSSTPLDVWADYAIIGAAKMTRGTIKFADWSEQMVKELGENIRPSLHSLYGRSREAYDISKKAARSLQQMTPEERAVEKVLKSGKITEAEADSFRLLAQNMSTLSGDVRRRASQDLQKILQGIEKPGLLRKISAAQTIAQLLNPKTQIRNIVGNEIFYRTERLNKLVATPIDIARSKLTGTDRVVTFRTNNQGQFWKNWFEGAKAGWKGVNINGLETQFELQGQAFRGKYNPMTYLEKALGASLRGFDNAAYMRAYNNTMGELATLDAINRGVKPTRDYVQNYIRNADDKIRQLSDNYGRYVTFQDNNVVSKSLQGIKRLMNANQDFGIGDIVLKYPKTPGALLVRALEYSPAGFVRSAVQLNKAVRYAEEGATREFVESLSRATIGTLGFAGMGYAMMDAGILTTASNRDRDIRSLEQGAGKGAYQINVSALKRFVKSGFDVNSAGGFKEGDQLYTYDWAQPISLAFSIGSEFQKGREEGKTADKIATGIGGAAINSFAGSLNTLTEQSVLSGLKDAAQGYPGQTVSDKLVDILFDVPASFVPTIVNQIRQAGDNTARETYDPNKVQQSLNMVKNRIPGLAQTLPKRYDSLGNAGKTYQEPSLFNIFINPGKPAQYKPEDVARDVLQLITETGDETLAPRVPQKKLQGVPLSGEQFSELSRLQGEQNRDRLSRINRDSSIKSQTNRTNKAIDKSAKEAKKDLLREYPDLKSLIKQNQK